MSNRTDVTEAARSLSSPRRYRADIAGRILKQITLEILALSPVPGSRRIAEFAGLIHNLDDADAVALWRPEMTQAMQIQIEDRKISEEFVEAQLALALWQSGSPVLGSFPLNADGPLFVRESLIAFRKGDVLTFGPDMVTCSRLEAPLLFKPKVAAGSLAQTIQLADLHRSAAGTSLEYELANTRLESLASCRDVIGSAFCTIEESGPDITNWVGNGVRAIYARGTKDKELHSGSAGNFAGVVSFALPIPQPIVSELLVHEASHQHFFVVGFSAPLVKPDAPEAYSPLKETNRPLKKLLLGYHAVQAILCFYGRHVWTDEVAIRRIRHNLSCAAAFERSIESVSAHLTEWGMELYRAIEGEMERTRADLSSYAKGLH